MSNPIPHVLVATVSHLSLESNPPCFCFCFCFVRIRTCCLIMSPPPEFLRYLVRKSHFSGLGVALLSDKWFYSSWLSQKATSSNHQNQLAPKTVFSTNKSLFFQNYFLENSNKYHCLTFVKITETSQPSSHQCDNFFVSKVPSEQSQNWPH